MADRLRLGVIGAGSWTTASHLPNLAKRREVEFAGVCRIGAEPLERIRAEWGFEVASEDYRDVLAVSPDIVVVGSPAALHAEHAEAALRAGAHVLVEKPFTVSPADARALVEIARRYDRRLLVSLGYNYRPLVVATRRHLADIGGIGDVEFASLEMSSVTRELLAGTGTYPRSDHNLAPEVRTWADPALAGGGYGQAQLSHALGVLLWLFALRPFEVSAITASALGASVEHYVAATVRYEGGAVGSVVGSSAHAGPPDRDYLSVSVVGSLGELRMEFHNDLVRSFRRGRGVEVLELAPGAGRYDCDGPPNALVDTALGDRAASQSPGEVGAATVELLDAVYRSARLGEPVRLGGC